MDDIDVTGSPVPHSADILTGAAVQFVSELHREFGRRRTELLAARWARRAQIARDHRLDFLPESAELRADESWRVAPAPPDLLDRRVEITGPTERKMAINALNSGARIWLADLEDANTPHWWNVGAGQVNLFDAVRRRIELVSAEGKEYRLRDDAEPAVIVMRPRGWHLDEAHVLGDGEPVAGALVDFGLYFFHNAGELLARGSGPYFYLPKLENHLEARLWNDVFSYAQQAFGIPHGSVRATVLIETVTAAFEMDEILYELREHASGLNAGRWDYLFSVIKNFRDAGADFVLPDRNTVTMTAPFMRAYTELLVRTCHRGGAFAMGGMAAFIPNRRDPEVTERALAKVREDKEREAVDGFDGSWVAEGLRNLMEDAATAEIARSQLWQWIRNGTELADGRPVTTDLVAGIIATEYERLQDTAGDRLTDARQLLEQVVLGEDYADFLTLPAYELIVTEDGR